MQQYASTIEAKLGLLDGTIGRKTSNDGKDKD